ncbi:KAP family P-loop domain-containing protein [Arachidicoccus rhizosphaerae]|uniref:KAP family P-loop domain-containing protein n=1 Tax=Arachidicoccus rhizosphaerae TaxID=551991 RepID=A0A1H4B0J1_9BACT|nr:P-loop NTPase fold protein [Arachidicoccus rhizosphaerae]SEA41661.1 KAP family P-loop domain-containing protein [Arachidicoccus rhizosphaerae]
MKGNFTSKELYKFLTNQPLGDDLFENKSQDRIAVVIKENIINEPEFKIIGIDGEWGAGKSNLIRLLEKKLENTHKFFVYDVWGHQEDEQRKAILVELTEFIKNENNLLKKVDKKIWDDKLKVLLAKSKEITTVNQPYLSVGFIFSLLSIIYIPTVNVFKDSMSDFFEIESWFWKLVLVTFPIFIVIGIYLWNLIKSWRKIGFWKSFTLSAEETFQVYTNKQKRETKLETISENQPSVRDFQNWMEDIDKDLNKKIVIVFDNFDRLPKKHILNIWSSIHIFFAEKGYSNIKVIIPFDREHVQNAFSELNGVDNKFGDDYINKTFDIVFRITLPIMSNWKKFFREQWEMAFVNFDEFEFRLVVQIYEFLGRRITPREIISFINEILTIKLIDDNFKERYIAIFVIRKNEILKDPLKAITSSKDILGGLASLYGNDANYAKQLTAIVYHIDVENAIELIYRQELKDSLVKNDTEQFNSICASDFVDSIFVSAISEIEVFDNPIIALSTLNGNSKVSSQYVNQAWSLFYDKVLQSDNEVSKLEIDKWQVTLIKNISDNRYLRNLLDGYFMLIDDSNIENYSDLIDGLAIELSDERLSNCLIERNVTADNYLRLIEYKGVKYAKYKLSTNYTSLDLHLSQLNIKDILSLVNTGLIPFVDYDFKEYKEQLKNSLVTFIDQNNIQSANDTFMKIKETALKSEGLKDLLDDSKVYSLYMNGVNSDLPIINELIAIRIARAEKFQSSYQSQFKNVLNTDDKNKAEEISNIILQYVTYGELLLKSSYFKDSLLFKEIIFSMFPKSSLDKKANILTLIENYDEIKTCLGIEDYKLLSELNKWRFDKTKLNIDKLSDDFVTDCLENSELRITSDFLEVFNENFVNFDKESYEVVFEDITDVHFKYFKLINPLMLTQTSLDAFESVFIEKLETRAEIESGRWDILEVYNKNNSSISIVNFLKNIRDAILRSRIFLDLEVAKKLLPYFFHYDLLTGQDNLFRLMLKNDFLTESDFVQLLILNSDYIKILYKGAQQLDKEGFRNLLNENREDSSELESLAKVLNIRKAKDKPEA